MAGWLDRLAGQAVWRGWEDGWRPHLIRACASCSSRRSAAAADLNRVRVRVKVRVGDRVG